MNGSPPVRMNAFDCPAMNEAEVRRSVAVEIPNQLRDEPEQAPPDSLVVDVWCSGGDIVVSVGHAGDTAAHVRRMPADSATGSAGSRTLALAIAELVRIAGAPPAVVVEPAATPAPPPGAADNRPNLFTAIGLAGGSFTAGGPYLFGAEVRWSVTWPNWPSHPDDFWVFGGTCALDVLGASFWGGSGELMTETFALAVMAQRRTGHFRPELAIGDRIGAAFFKADFELIMPPVPSSRRLVNGPFVEAGLGFVAGRTYARAGVEAVLLTPAPGKFEGLGRSVDFSGVWLIATLKLGLNY